MICMHAESHLCTFTLILYTCIFIPFLQITQSVVRIFPFLFKPNGQRGNARSVCEVDLLVLSFQDLEFSNKNRGKAVSNGEEMCSICLMEFEKEDLVNKLPRCGHLFHMECMEKWLDRCQFTCPLCRSSVLPVGPLPCKMWVSVPPPVIRSSCLLILRCIMHIYMRPEQLVSSD
ncbi:RING-H2 finger protein ATL18 [Sesamum alatum]|uniref:RING-H2 finger protein ATL18 n=1 Tax=Sesamum alatum TaxID=300844 RepID=A0AAE1YZ33_9LAMI|nr:RING-H2 finger protein ATL18 [Sesamum alatum]